MYKAGTKLTFAIYIVADFSRGFTESSLILSISIRFNYFNKLSTSIKELLFWIEILNF